MASASSGMWRQLHVTASTMAAKEAVKEAAVASVSEAATSEATEAAAARAAVTAAATEAIRRTKSSYSGRKDTAVVEAKQAARIRNLNSHSSIFGRRTNKCV